MHYVEGTHIAWQRNQVVRQMEGGWVFFLDTDQVCAPDTLLRLLAVRQPIVSALIAQRHAPFRPAVFRNNRELLWAEIPEHGVLEVDAIGTGCVLIYRAAFNRISEPWFRQGTLNCEMVGEDIAFSHAAAAAGLPLYLACDVHVGHQTTATIWPHPNAGVKLELPGDPPVVIVVPKDYAETH